MATIKSDDTGRRRQPAARRAVDAAPGGNDAAGSAAGSSEAKSQASPDAPASLGLPTPEAALGL